MEPEAITAVPRVHIKVRDPRRARNRRRAAVNSHHVNQYLLRQEIRHTHYGQPPPKMHHKTTSQNPKPNIKELTTRFYENGGLVKSTQMVHKKIIQAHKGSIKSQRMLLTTQIELRHWLEMKMAKEKHMEDFKAIEEKSELEKRREELEERIQKRRRDQRDQIQRLQEEIEKMRHQSLERAETRKEEIRINICREGDELIQIRKVIENYRSERQNELDEKLKRAQTERERLLREKIEYEEEHKNSRRIWEMAMRDWKLREGNRKEYNVHLEAEFKRRVEDDLHDSVLDRHQIGGVSKNSHNRRTIENGRYVPGLRHPTSLNPSPASSPDSTPVQRVDQKKVYIYIGYQEHGVFVYRHNHPWKHLIGGPDEDINLIKRINKEYAKLKPNNWRSIQSVGFARYIRWDITGADENHNPIWEPAEERGIIHFEDGRSVELFEHFHKIPEALGRAKKWIDNLEEFVKHANDEKGTKCWIMIEIFQVPNFRKCFWWLCIALTISTIAGVVYGVGTGDAATAISLASYILACGALLLAFIAAGQYMGYAKPEDDAFTYKLGGPEGSLLGWALPRMDPAEIFLDNSEVGARGDKI